MTGFILLLIRRQCVNYSTVQLHSASAYFIILFWISFCERWGCYPPSVCLSRLASVPLLLDCRRSVCLRMGSKGWLIISHCSRAETICLSSTCVLPQSPFISRSLRCLIRNVFCQQFARTHYINKAYHL